MSKQQHSFPDDASLLQYVIEHCDDVTGAVFFEKPLLHPETGNLIGCVLAVTHGTGADLLALPESTAASLSASGVLDRLRIPCEVLRLRSRDSDRGA